MKTIEILIQPPSTELIRGQTMCIPVTLNVEKPVKVRGIHATFHGAAETKADYTTYNAATKSSQTHTAVQLVEIVKQEFLLSGREYLGVFGNIADGIATIFGSGSHDLLQPGHHEFEVQLEVPQDAPGAFTGKKCRVFYELNVRVDIPMGLDAKSTFAFKLPGVENEAASDPVMIRYPEDQERGLLDSWFGPDLRVEAGVAGSQYRRGEEIEGIFRAQSPSPLACRAISVCLVGFEKTQAQGHTDGHTYTGPATVLSEPGAIDRCFEQDFRIAATVEGPPSASGQLHSVAWYIQIQLDVPWAKDPKIRIPIKLLD